MILGDREITPTLSSGATQTWKETGMTSEERASITIIGEWTMVRIPSPPELKHVILDPESTALLILDIQSQNCN